MERLSEQIFAIENLPSGTVALLTLTDDDATAAAQEYLDQNEEELRRLTQQNFGIALEASNLQIEFKPDVLLFSIDVGIKLLKITLSARANVLWKDDSLNIDVTSIDIPIISVDPAVVNSYIQEPIQSIIDQITEGFDIRDFKLEDGYASVEVIKK